jgi:response regulator RpfG family c-di-GMP phosphodiesterase
MTALNEGVAPLVYVVDDDDEIRQVLQRYLEKNNIEAVGMPSADELLRRLLRRRPDLVVLDLMMPGTSGLDALQQLCEAHDDLPAFHSPPGRSTACCDRSSGSMNRAAGWVTAAWVCRSSIAW